MSDLAATGCCNNDCGCMDHRNGGCNSWIWIIILLFLCGGCGCDDGDSRFGLSRCGDNDCSFIIIILLLLFCCGSC